eukprot:403332593
MQEKRKQSRNIAQRYANQALNHSQSYKQLSQFQLHSQQIQKAANGMTNQKSFVNLQNLNEQQNSVKTQNDSKQILKSTSSVSNLHQTQVTQATTLPSSTTHKNQPSNFMFSKTNNALSGSKKQNRLYQSTIGHQNSNLQNMKDQVQLVSNHNITTKQGNQVQQIGVNIMMNQKSNLRKSMQISSQQQQHISQQQKDSNNNQLNQSLLQSEKSKKLLLSTLIQLGKQIDKKTKFLNQFEKISGESLESELFNFLKQCILKQSLNYETTKLQLKQEQQSTDNYRSIIQEQKQLIDRMKNSNVMLLRELKDLKNVLQECRNNLEASNQNSEILERIQLHQGISQVENDFESFLKEEDALQNKILKQESLNSRYTSKLPDTGNIQKKDGCFSFNQDSNFHYHKFNENMETENITQIISLNPIKSSAHYSRVNEPQIINYSFSDNSSIIQDKNQQQEITIEILRNPKIIKKSNQSSQNFSNSQWNYKQNRPVMIIQDEEETTKFYAGTSSCYLNDDDDPTMTHEFEESPNVSMLKRDKSPVENSVHEIRCSTPIKGISELNSPINRQQIRLSIENPSHQTLQLIQKSQDKRLTLTDFSSPMMQFSNHNNTTTKAIDRFKFDSNDNLIRSDKAFIPNTKSPQNNQSVTLSQILNGLPPRNRNSQVYHSMLQFNKRSSLNNNSRCLSQSNLITYQQLQTAQSLQNLRLSKNPTTQAIQQNSLNQLTMETSKSDLELDPNDIKNEVQNDYIHQQYQKSDNQNFVYSDQIAPLSKQEQAQLQAQQRFVQLINLEISTPQFGSPRHEQQQQNNGPITPGSQYNQNFLKFKSGKRANQIE